MATRVTTSAPRRRARRADAPGDIEQSVCDATERLLETRLFADLSVADVIAEAGVSRASFYFYFASKYDLLSAVSARAIDEVYELTRSWLARAAEEPPRAALESAMLGAVDGWRRHGPVLRAIVDASASSPQIDEVWRLLISRFIDGATEQIERERAAGFAPERGGDARTLAATLTWMTERSLYLLVSGGERSFADEQRLAETLTSVWWQAIYGAGVDGTGASSGLSQSR
jgi:AcrR family transcriptional regulator